MARQRVGHENKFYNLGFCGVFIIFTRKGSHLLFFLFSCLHCLLFFLLVFLVEFVYLVNLTLI